MRVRAGDSAGAVGGLRKSPFVSRKKLDFQFVLTFAAYNLVRMRNLGVAVLTCAYSRGWCLWKTLNGPESIEMEWTEKPDRSNFTQLILLRIGMNSMDSMAISTAC